MTTHSTLRTANTRAKGQTLIIAIIIMGILLILGIAFSLIVSNSVRLTGNAVRRSVADDLALAGIQTMHERMLNSSADAGFLNTNPVFLNDFTKDPDAMYLRPADPSLPYPSNSGNIRDLGGPDGLGTFVRFEYDRGRALVRVRYAPSDFDAFSDPTGVLRSPGKARRYLIIEAIGRPGRITVGGKVDPTRQLDTAVKIRNYTDSTDFANSLAAMHEIDARVVPSKKMIAFATLGVGDYALYITDKYKTRRMVDLGVPAQGAVNTVNSAVSLAAYFRGNPVKVPLAIGRVFAEPNSGSGNAWTTVPGLGNIYSNTSLRINGNVFLSLNASLGERLSVAGDLEGANDVAQLELSRTYYDVALDRWLSDWQANPSTISTPITVNQASMDSSNPAFDTFGDIVRDDAAQPDPGGYQRYVQPIEAPVIDRVDQQGRDNYYVEITRDSGPVMNGVNIGRYGYGPGVYVDYMSPYNRQRRNEDERSANASNSLVDVWFNPNSRDNTVKAGSWAGPYFIPDAAYLRLLPDGFSIVRPGNSGEQQNSDTAFWRDPTSGNSTGQSICRFRIRTIAGQTWILNSIQFPGLVALPAGSLADSDFTNNGQPFEGVIYFEGDVRVRGVIPTDQQLTVVSMGNIYIDGSITKGVVSEAGAILSRPSRSMLSLLARDNVAINTTQFFAPAPNDLFGTKDDSPLPDTPTPIELGVDGDSGVDPDVNLQMQLLMQTDPDPGHPAINPSNPLTWEPYATSYAPWTGPASIGPDFDVYLALVTSANDGGPSYVSGLIRRETYADLTAPGEISYLFSRILNFGTAGNVTFNAADPFFTPGPKIPVYGEADPSINVFPKFETVQFPLVTVANWAYSPGSRSLAPGVSNPEGQYELGLSDETVIRLRNNAIGAVGQKEFLIARSTVIPYDVRIEASLYAQNGSFYVIPGPWFNMNTDDTRERFENDVANIGRDAAERLRFERFGNTPSIPFSEEPLDCRVTIVGAVSENLPAPISRQAEWMQKWGWIPKEIGGTGQFIPWQHVPSGFDLNTQDAVPNFIIVHDPALAGASADGITPIRTDATGRALPPTPRLPVSPTLVYFGEVNP
ncbi:MAG TPA: hypothetical protein VNI20_01255 [Fimbriimonadaceae bacterium]|nr:hypothetical protein [Fimbriimonadaceae bacterium]